MTTSSTRRTFCHAPFTYWICYLRSLSFVKGSAICQHSPQIRRDHGVSDHIDVDPGFLNPLVLFPCLVLLACVCVCVLLCVQFNMGIQITLRANKKTSTAHPEPHGGGLLEPLLRQCWRQFPTCQKLRGPQEITIFRPQHGFRVCFCRVPLVCLQSPKWGRTPQRRHQVANQG